MNNRDYKEPTTDETILTWHWSDRFLTYDRDETIRDGMTLACDPMRIGLCHYGFHSSPRLVDSMIYGSNTCAALSLCESGGTIIYGHDKLVASIRRHLVIADGSDFLDELFIWCMSELLSIVPAAFLLRDVARILFISTWHRHSSAMAVVKERALKYRELQRIIYEEIEDFDPNYLSLFCVRSPYLDDFHFSVDNHLIAPYNNKFILAFRAKKMLSSSLRWLIERMNSTKSGFFTTVSEEMDNQRIFSDIRDNITSGEPRPIRDQLRAMMNNPDILKPVTFVKSVDYLYNTITKTGEGCRSTVFYDILKTRWGRGAAANSVEAAIERAVTDLVFMTLPGFDAYQNEYNEERNYD